MRIKGRNEGRRSTHKKILIVCEGAKTEPSYFGGFRVAKDICDVKGIGANTLSLVKKAEKLKNEGDYSEVWCVFDRDSFPRKNVHDAISLVGRLGFKYAFSNEAFELWYILHFNYLDTKVSRKDYCTRMDKYLGFPYTKNSPAMYGILLSRQKDAIKNAKTLERKMNGSGGSLCDMKPLTTVHHLVERLNALAKRIPKPSSR